MFALKLPSQIKKGSSETVYDAVGAAGGHAVPAAARSAQQNGAASAPHASPTVTCQKAQKGAAGSAAPQPGHMAPCACHCAACYAAGHNVTACVFLCAGLRDLFHEPGIVKRILQQYNPEGACSWATVRFDAGITCVQYGPAGDVIVAGVSNGRIHLICAQTGENIWCPWSKERWNDTGAVVEYKPDGLAYAVTVETWRCAKASGDGGKSAHFWYRLRGLSAGSDVQAKFRTKGAQSWVAYTGAGRMVKDGEATWWCTPEWVAGGNMEYEQGLWVDGVCVSEGIFGPGQDEMVESIPEGTAPKAKLHKRVPFKVESVADRYQTGADALLKEQRDAVVMERERKWERVRVSDSIVCSVAISPDGTMLAAGLGSGVLIIDAQSGEIKSSMKAHSHMVLSVSWSPCGQWLASGGIDMMVWIYDAKTFEVKSGFNLGSSVNSVRFSPSCDTVAAGCYNGTVRIIDAVTDSILSGFFEQRHVRGHTDRVLSVSWSPDGTRLASGSEDNTVRLWDASTGAPIGSPLRGHTDHVRSVCFSPDGSKIASGSSDKKVLIWDTASGEQMCSLRGHTSGVNGVVFHPKKNILASCSDDETIKLWNTDTGAKLSTSGSADATVRNWNPAARGSLS